MLNLLKHSSISVSRAFYTTLGIGAFFFAMKALGLADNTYLRGLNLIILFVGIYSGLSAFKVSKRSKFSYINGLLMGIKIGALTTLMLSVSIFLYYMIDPTFLNEVIYSRSIAQEQSIFSVIGIIAIECLGSGVLCSYASMQSLRINTHSYSKA